MDKEYAFTCRVYIDRGRGHQVYFRRRWIASLFSWAARRSSNADASVAGPTTIER